MWAAGIAATSGSRGGRPAGPARSAPLRGPEPASPSALPLQNFVSAHPASWASSLPASTPRPVCPGLSPAPRLTLQSHSRLVFLSPSLAGFLNPLPLLAPASGHPGQAGVPVPPSLSPSPFRPLLCLGTLTYRRASPRPSGPNTNPTTSPKDVTDPCLKCSSPAHFKVLSIHVNTSFRTG